MENDRVSVALTSEQTTAVLKLHRSLLQAKLAKFEATTSSVAGSIPNPLGEPHQIVYTSVVRMNLLHFDKK
jgi:hypothetical protein